MPSWNEKPHVIPNINVNLKPCTCPAGYPTRGGEHHGGCASAPVLIPCPIPRSVTFEVRLGRCTCPPPYFDVMRNYGNHVSPACPALSARPIRVACSIGGETWAESEVEDIERCGPDAPPDVVWDMAATRALGICRERWALVKALVLGEEAGPWMLSEAWAETWDKAAPLFAQRDSVCAALADMARAEEAAFAAQQRAEKAFPYHRLGRVGDGSHAGPRPSHARLEAYVEFLVEQVGVL